MVMDIYIIPDTQSKEGVFNPLIPVAYHICKIKPDLVIHLGDHWDMPSLSSYDKGKKSHEAKTYRKDISAANYAMECFWAIIDAEWPEAESECEFEFLLGNHCDRIRRAMEYGSEDLRDLMRAFPPDYSRWKKHEFLKVIKRGGVCFSHFFANNNSGKPIGTARQLLLKKHVSCVAGHMQGFNYDEQLTDKKTIQAIIAGSCYFHDESYKMQSNHHWRGTLLLKNVRGGMFEFNRYSLFDLASEYGV
jgi:hypothetical protein